MCHTHLVATLPQFGKQLVNEHHFARGLDQGVGNVLVGVTGLEILHYLLLST